MDQEKRMTVPDLLCYLRQRLLEARGKNDDAILDELAVALTVLREVGYISEDKKFIALVTALEDSARDAIMRVPFKSTIPSVEEIRAAFPDAA